MAKSTKYGGVSYTDDEMQDAARAVLANRPMIGGELKSVGTNLQPSSKKEDLKNSGENPSNLSPVQTTGNLSNQDPEESSTAPLTGGSGRRTRAQKSVKRANVRSTSDDDDFDEFDED